MGSAQDYNYRIINVGNNRLDFTANAGGTVTMDAGNVGIGTTAPSSKLHVYATGYPRLKVESPSGGNPGLYLINGADSANQQRSLIAHTGGNMNFYMINDAEAIAYTPLQLLANGNVTMAGNVGIGTTGPSEKLSVAGNVSVQETVAQGVIHRGTVNGSYGLQLSGSTNAIVNDTYPGASITVSGGTLTDGYEGNIDLIAYGGVQNSATRNAIRFLRRTGVDTISESMRIDGSGNVGIGTTGPGSALSFGESLGRKVQYYDNGTSPSGVRTASGLIVDNYISAASDAITWSTYTGAISSPTYTERMRITTGGNVGIGTTAPGAKLELTGTASSYEAIRISEVNFPTYNWGFNYANTDGSLRINPGSGNSAANLILLPTGTGNVGIGTTGPGAKLWVQNIPATGDGQIVAAYDASNYLKIRDNFLDIVGGNDFYIKHGGSEKVTVKVSGNVGIGTTGPSEALHVIGRVRIANGTAALPSLNFQSGSITGLSLIDNGVTSGVTISSGGAAVLTAIGGNVGIGTTNPLYTLDVKSTGTDIARFNGSGSTGCTLSDGGIIACSSDFNLKKNITDSGFGLDAIMALRPVEFNWKSNPDSTSKSLGFIAQDVELVIPKLVSIDPSGNRELNTIGLIPVLTKGLQELNAKVSPLLSAIIVNSDGTIAISGGLISTSGNVGTGTLHVEGQCVTGDTMLPIRRRKRRKNVDEAEDSDDYDYFYCRIDEVQIGDQVLSLDEGRGTDSTSDKVGTGTLGYARINALMDMDVHDVYELTTKSGRKIRTTSNHPYLTLVEEGIGDNPIVLENSLRV